VAEVASVGGFPIEYNIETDPRRLILLGLTLQDVVEAVIRSNAAVGGHVIHKGNAEFIVRSAGWIGAGRGDADFDPRRAVRDLENIVLPRAGGGPVRLTDVATISLGSQPRRGVLEKDGSEVTGGVVLMRQGENPLEVTRRLQDKIQELQVGLPPGVRIVPFYDRTPLIHGAIGTVTTTLVEAILTAAICVLIVLLHFRTSFVITLTLPLAALGSFVIMWTLRRLGLADIQTNVMSLAGIAISIGVLVDSSIVMAENVMHVLQERFGDRPVTGDVRDLVLFACRTVGRPILFSVLIMLLSFLPVFALGGIEGKMFHPLAFTKCFALITVAVLAITLVPALCTIFIRGRLRGEMDSWVVRGVIRAYRPVLGYFLDHSAPLVWLIGVTFVLGVTPLGIRWVFLATLFLALVASVGTARHSLGRIAAGVSLMLIALVADQNIQPLGREFITPLDEGMVMDMPITVPRASVTQSADDLKARDMIFCRFPEVDMVVGKAGRAETATDPAPLDMIETMVNFRAQEFWPKRKLRPTDAERQAQVVLDALVEQGLIRRPADRASAAGLVNEAVMAALPRFDALMRECAYQSNQEFERDLGRTLIRFGQERTASMLHDNGSLRDRLTPAELTRLAVPGPAGLSAYLARDLTLGDVTLLAQDTVRQLAGLGYLSAGSDSLRYRPGYLAWAVDTLDSLVGGRPPTLAQHLQEDLAGERKRRWCEHTHQLNGELLDRAAGAYIRIVLEELLTRSDVLDDSVTVTLGELKRLRAQAPAASAGPSGHHHGSGAALSSPGIDPNPTLDTLQTDLTRGFANKLLLWPKERADLAGFGGELDRVMQMPGWTNVWTMPIQNRVDMLSTGVNTTLGVRVLGRKLDDVVRASEEVAAVLKHLPGAADVVADPVRGKGYIEVHPDREKAARHGVNVGDINDVVEIALAGRIVTQTVESRERHPVRIRYPRAWREDEQSIGNLLVPVRTAGPAGVANPLRNVLLSQVADIQVVEGPASIKSENGLLRNYVRLNVRGRGSREFVEEARRVVAEQVRLPVGVFLEWTGQFEHEERARNTLLVILPLVVGLIFLVLYFTYRDLADALLMLLAVPGAIAGGIFFQWLFGYPFSVTVWVGYIACFGMATATGIIMLVYLREAVAKGGGLAHLSLEQLRLAVLDGAAQRLRPKLLTECTTVLGLAPLLWAHGVGAEILRPMVIPVLGGLLVADEVIDLFLPVLFYKVRRWRWQRLHRGNDHADHRGC
jgi:Cu(I)/Ag(I) efflux system membrane protein CusA/SilA